MHTDKKKGRPLGRPEYKGLGDARPDGAGAEGGLGFVGDQRGSAREDELPTMDVDTPPGTPDRPVHEVDDEDHVK